MSMTETQKSRIDMYYDIIVSDPVFGEETKKDIDTLLLKGFSLQAACRKRLTDHHTQGMANFDKIIRQRLFVFCLWGVLGLVGNTFLTYYTDTRWWGSIMLNPVIYSLAIVYSGYLYLFWRRKKEKLENLFFRLIAEFDEIIT